MHKILGKELSNNNFLTTLEQLLQVQCFAIIVDVVSNNTRLLIDGVKPRSLAMTLVLVTDVFYPVILKLFKSS